MIVINTALAENFRINPANRFLARITVFYHTDPMPAAVSGDVLLAYVRGAWQPTAGYLAEAPALSSVIDNLPTGKAMEEAILAIRRAAVVGANNMPIQRTTVRGFDLDGE